MGQVTHATRRGTTVEERRRRAPIVTEGATSDHDQMMHLQSLVGNAGATALLEDHSTPEGQLLQRKKSRGNNRKKGGGKKGGGRNARPQTPKVKVEPEPTETPEDAPAESQSWGSWFGGLVTGGLSMVGISGANSGDEVVSGAGEKAEGTWGTFGEEHDEPIDAEELLGIPEISITLAKGELKREVDGLEAEGAYELKQLLDGYEGSANFEAKYGSGSSASSGDYTFYEGSLFGEFTAERFVGAKFGGKTKGTLTSSKAVLRGEANAFAGLEYKGSTKIKVKVGGEEIASFDGGLGVSVGLGGEAKGHISWEGGKLSLGSKGALAAGLGVAWEYKLEIDSPALASGLWSWAAGWVSWLGDVASSLDEALTDEDGDPIRIF